MSFVFGLQKINTRPYSEEKPTLQLFFYCICQRLEIIASTKGILRSSSFTIPTAVSQSEHRTKFGTHAGVTRT